MRRIPVDRHGLRLRAMIVVLWRGGLRIQEALDLTESDLDARRGSILVRAARILTHFRTSSSIVSVVRTLATTAS